MDGWLVCLRDGLLSGRLNSRLDVWLDGWKDGWFDVWFDGWLDGRLASSVLGVRGWVSAIAMHFLSFSSFPWPWFGSLQMRFVVLSFAAAAMPLPVAEQCLLVPVAMAMLRTVA